MVFVLNPLTQSEQMGDDDVQAEYKHKSRLVICGNFASWGEHSTTTTNLDAPLLRLMPRLSCSAETTWSSKDITSAFLNADIHDDHTVLVTPPPVLVKMDIVEPNTVWHVKKAYLWSSRSTETMATREREREIRNSVQACSPCPKLHPPKPMVHCRGPQSINSRDSTIRSLLEKR